MKEQDDGKNPAEPEMAEVQAETKPEAGVEAYGEVIKQLHEAHQRAEQLISMNGKLTVEDEAALRAAQNEIEAHGIELTKGRESEQLASLLNEADIALTRAGETISGFEDKVRRLEAEEEQKKIGEYREAQKKEELLRSLDREGQTIDYTIDFIQEAKQAAGSEIYIEKFGGNKNRLGELNSLESRLAKLKDQIEKEKSYPKEQRTEQLIEKAVVLIEEADKLADKTIKEVEAEKKEKADAASRLGEVLALAERFADQLRIDGERRNQTRATQAVLGGFEAGAQALIQEINSTLRSGKISEEQISALRGKVDTMLRQSNYEWMTKKREPAPVEEPAEAEEKITEPAAETDEVKQEPPAAEAESVVAPEKPVETVQKEEYKRLSQDTDELNKLDAALFERIEGLADRMTTTEILTLGDPDRRTRSQELQAKLKALEKQMLDDPNFHPRPAEIADLVQQAREDLNSYKIDIEEVEQRIANIKPGEPAPEPAPAREKGEPEAGKTTEAKPGLFSRLRGRASEFLRDKLGRAAPQGGEILRGKPEAEIQAETKENLDDYKTEIALEVKTEYDAAFGRLNEIVLEYGPDPDKFADDYDNYASYHFLRATQDQLLLYADLSAIENADSREAVKKTAEAKIAIVRGMLAEAEKRRRKMPVIRAEEFMTPSRVSRQEMSDEELQKAAKSAEKISDQETDDSLLEMARGKEGKFDKETAATTLETYLTRKYEKGVQELEKIHHERPSKKTERILAEAKKYRKFISERGIASLRSWDTFADMDFFRKEYEDDLNEMLAKARQESQSSNVKIAGNKSAARRRVVKEEKTTSQAAG